MCNSIQIFYNTPNAFQFEIMYGFMKFNIHHIFHNIDVVCSCFSRMDTKIK
jgi:hypothetical protein